MGFGSVAPSAYCRAPLWAAPPSSAWFAPHHLVTVPAMNDASEFCKSPKSTQSNTDSSVSSTEGRVGNSGPIQPASNKVDPNIPTRCMWKGCGKAFTRLDNLSAHVAAEHATVQEGLFYCGWEGCLRGHRGFNARYKMLVHVRTHTKERPHSCLVCGKSFSRAENLKIHARSHSGEKPYVCTVPGCGKAYSNSSDRFKHTRTHMVEKPYCCKIPGCQKRYTDPSSLRKHVKTFKHTNVETTEKQTEAKNTNNKNGIQENGNQFYRKFDKFVTITTKQNLSERDEFERISEQYSYQENDCFIPENVYRFDLESAQANFNFENAPTYLSKLHQDDITNDLCFCKDLPCIHTSRYVQPEFIRVSPLTYDRIESNPMFEPPIKEINTKFRDEPLNLKRKYFEGDLMGLEKIPKTEFRDILEDECIEAPLDLSRKKYF